MAPQSYFLVLVGGCAMTFVTVFAVVESFDGEAALGQAKKAASAVAAGATYYPGCNAVRAAGKAPLYRGQPGYREGMDGDNDGIACEPYPGRVSVRRARGAIPPGPPTTALSVRSPLLDGSPRVVSIEQGR